MASTNAGRSALLFGATGATGKHVLQELLASKDFGKVIEAGRRVTPAEALNDVPGKEKLVQKIVDFDKIEEAGLKDEKADVVIITLGTTRAIAGSEEKFLQIDRDYPISAAKAAKSDGEQKLVYLSSTGANASSFLLYSRSKGQTEQGLAGLGYSDTIVFRPGLLKDADRGDHRILETVYGKVTGFLSHFTPTLEISVKSLAKSIVSAAALGSASLPATTEVNKVNEPHPYSVITNKGALALFQAHSSSN
ncbi:Protein fmp52, mitochondrial [Tulasnella sp. 418]|nr:Protein fmp52, mitochondrial [Tulasnella sp. 418]